MKISVSWGLVHPPDTPGDQRHRERKHCAEGEIEKCLVVITFITEWVYKTHAREISSTVFLV